MREPSHEHRERLSTWQTAAVQTGRKDDKNAAAHNDKAQPLLLRQGAVDGNARDRGAGRGRDARGVNARTERVTGRADVSTTHDIMESVNYILPGEDPSRRRRKRHSSRPSEGWWRRRAHLDSPTVKSVSRSPPTGPSFPPPAARARQRPHEVRPPEQSRRALGRAVRRGHRSGRGFPAWDRPRTAP